MFYTGFDHYITARYGIIIKNWPLPKFINPSKISTKTELDILWAAWNSNAASFYKMNTQEFREWEAEQTAQVMRKEGGSTTEGSSPTAGAENDSATTEIQDEGPMGGDEGAAESPVNSSEATTAHTVSTPAGPSNFVLMSMVTDANGVPVMAKGKKTRKPRSDRGKTHKKKAPAGDSQVV